ncbi:MAG: MFS transporter [Alicyclobacillus sp.]|nr:MFS transporter [Alicyclobacillus sp.]
MQVVTAPSAPAIGRRQMVSAITASVLGWSLDLFDLFVLLYVAPVVGTLFFPSNNAVLSLAAVYASFAVTLLMRPLGSGLFGSYADRRGRKRAMTVAVVGVGIATAVLGLLPTYPQAGVLAPILFLVLRLVQGVFVGGVVASTHTIGTETVGERWRGAMSGLIGGGGAGIGSLIASVIYLIVSQAFPGPAFAVWGWRCMFLTGLLSSLLGLFVFRWLEESPLWLQQAQQRHRPHDRTEAAAAPAVSPVRTVFSARYLPTLLVNLMIVIGGGAAYYLTSGILPTFLKVINKTPQVASSGILMLASVAAIVSAVLFGYLSEVTGRKKMFIVLAILELVGLPWTYAHLAMATALGAVTWLSVLLAFLGNAAYAPILVFLNERYPTAIRSSGTGLSWNMGFAVGGMMPTFVTLASGQTSNLPHTLAVFAVVLFVLYLIGALIVPETKGRFDA